MESNDADRENASGQSSPDEASLWGKNLVPAAATSESSSSIYALTSSSPSTSSTTWSSSSTSFKTITHSSKRRMQTETKGNATKKHKQKQTRAKPKKRRHCKMLSAGSNRYLLRLGYMKRVERRLLLEQRRWLRESEETSSSSSMNTQSTNSSKESDNENDAVVTGISKLRATGKRKTNLGSSTVAKNNAGYTLTTMIDNIDTNAVDQWTFTDF